MHSKRGSSDIILIGLCSFASRRDQRPFLRFKKKPVPTVMCYTQTDFQGLKRFSKCSSPAEHIQFTEMEAQPVPGLTRGIVIRFRFNMLVFDSQGLLSFVHCSMTFPIFTQGNGSHLQGWTGAYLLQLNQFQLETSPLLVVRVINVRCLVEFVFFAYSRDNQGQDNRRQGTHGQGNQQQNNNYQINQQQNSNYQNNQQQNSNEQNNQQQNNQQQNNQDQNNQQQNNNYQNNQPQNNEQEDLGQEWLGMQWISDEL